MKYMLSLLTLFLGCRYYVVEKSPYEKKNVVPAFVTDVEPCAKCGYYAEVFPALNDNKDMEYWRVMCTNPDCGQSTDWIKFRGSAIQVWDSTQEKLLTLKK